MNEIGLSFTLSRKSLIRFMLEVLFLLNLFFALFPAWRLSPLWNYFEVDDYFNVWMGLLAKLNVVTCVAILILQTRIPSRSIFYMVVLLSICVALSMFANYMPTGCTTLICFPLEYLVICAIAREYTFGPQIIKLTFICLSIWSILPLLVMLVGPLEYQIAMVTDVHGLISTFGGFAYHRNFYGFYAGLTILLSLFLRMNNFVKTIVILLCMVGIAISGSRSALMCTFGAIMFYYYLTNKKKFLLILPIIVAVVAGVIFAYAYFSIRSKGLEDNDDRFEIYRGFANFISANPIWGNGEATLYFSAHYPLGAPAHNFLLQIWADYGLITLLCMLFFIALIFFKSNNYMKVLLLYLLLFGFSQPYFYLSMPAAFMMIVFLLGNCVDFSGKKQVAM